MEEDTRAVCSKDKVEKLPRRGRRMTFFTNGNEDHEDGEKIGAVESDLDWESWILGQWSKAANEVEGCLTPNPIET